MLYDLTDVWSVHSRLLQLIFIANTQYFVFVL